MESDTKLISVESQENFIDDDTAAAEDDVDMSDDVSDECDHVIDDFTDPKKIVPPANLKELIHRLHVIFEQDRINVDYVKALMESYKSNPREWKKFAKFDVHRYTRNLVDQGNGKFNLMVLCWNEAQASSIHSHAGSHCFLKVLSGNVKEEMYGWPDDRVTSERECCMEVQPGVMTPRDELLFDRDQCTYICDDLGLHRVENPSHSDKAVTLHLYSPPFDECYCFDERTGRKIPAKVTFWSKFGKRTPFGKDSTIAATCQKEIN